MARDGKPTRDKILQESKALILQNGYAGTSIDHILEKTALTKGAFFYHFKTKNDLAKALIEEFIRLDLSTMEAALKNTQDLKDKPLDRLLKFIQIFIDVLAGLKAPHPGCLYASFINESNLFDEEIKKDIAKTILTWRDNIEILMQNILEQYDMVIEEDLNSLADTFTVIFEGGFILSKSVNEPDLTAKQLRHLQNYLQILFVPKK
ncbi:TetR/AcrR family transcriptional regulator [Confluentibacter citreus]|uniref:TetR/AcrR family transcriptional regulator n=1 Tax=Confluentibacter citreus TaxID=2007307 RepID=UPI000C295177|nr:TetR/AcrR family transcriptional regulator [Confluentibacter citreus]